MLMDTPTYYFRQNVNEKSIRNILKLILHVSSIFELALLNDKG